MVISNTPRVSFRAQMLAAREQAIIGAVNRLLSEKGFEAMTVDEVAAAVGVAKASLYKHFPSKEDLAAAAMSHLLAQAQVFLDSLDPKRSPLDKLRATVQWVMRLKLEGNMPALPSQNSSLRAALMASKTYVNGLIAVGDTLGTWIVEAQAQGEINPKLPPLVVLYTLYARACDPVLEFLKMSQMHSDDDIIALVMETSFDGLRARGPQA
jgi:AcrR family transcriptional regulator